MGGEAIGRRREIHPDLRRSLQTVPMGSTLLLAAAQPRSVLADVEFNVGEHPAEIRSVGARLVLFPELSLTGYAMDAEPLDPSDERLAPLTEACAATGSVALVGAATTGDDGGGNRISMLRVDKNGISVVYSKMYLGGDEPEHYQPGKRPVAMEIDGWRLGLAICKDNGQPEHAAETAELGIDAYVAGVCESEQDRDDQPTRSE